MQYKLNKHQAVHNYHASTLAQFKLFLSCSTVYFTFIVGDEICLIHNAFL